MKSLLRRDEGQGLAEYALILSMVAIAVVAALAFFGTSLTTMLSTIADDFASLPH